jgi:acyl carrier protein
MPMTKEEIYAKVQEVLVDALGVDDEDVKGSATLREDLGAESIDFLDIVFRLEKAFNIKIPRGELFPEGLLNDPNFAQNGKVTEAGLAELKKRMPHSDFTEFDKNPTVENMAKLFTVDTIVKYIQSKVA